jgi:cobalt/nickel transport system permease protein
LYSFGLLASNLFIRSWDRSDRLYTSMDARCYDGDLSALGEDI